MGNRVNVNSRISLKQVIPTLGKVHVELFEPAASIYKVCRDREIKRLRGLLQLGQLSHIHSGAHHTRWDYIMLKLYLLRVFKENCPGAGLSSEVPSLGLTSGCQALQAYILLRNFGHLEGCFETERLVLEACITSAHARKMLLGLVPDRFKSWAKELIETESLFRFYQLLAVIFVAHGPEFRNSPELQAQSSELLYKFLVKPDNRIQVLKDRHREIRTLAYLALDTHYAPVGVEFNLGSILVAAREFGQRIFATSTSPFQNLNLHIMTYVEDVVYRSPHATWLFAEFRRSVYPKILRRLNRLRTQNGYFQYLEELRREVPDFKHRSRPVFTKLLLDSPFRYTQREKAITKSKELASKFLIPDSHLGLAALPSRRPSHVYVYYPSGVLKEKGQIAHRYKVILEELALIRKNNARDLKGRGRPSFVLERNVSTSLYSLFRSVLYLLTGNKYEIILERAGIPIWLSGICSQSKPKAQQQLRAILKSPYMGRLPKDRLSELQCILATIPKTSGGTTSACLSNIKVLRKPEFMNQGDEYEVAEIDAAVLVANAWHTKLFLVESKKQRAGSAAAARKQLKSLIEEKIQIGPAFAPGIENIVEIPNKGAFLPIKLP